LIMITFHVLYFTIVIVGVEEVTPVFAAGTDAIDDHSLVN